MSPPAGDANEVAGRAASGPVERMKKRDESMEASGSDREIILSIDPLEIDNKISKICFIGGNVPRGHFR